MTDEPQQPKSLDISGILREWPFEPGQINVRKIYSDDGREMIQLRLDLGLLQMEMNGRPDGQRPEGHDSLLDYYEHELDLHRQRHGTDEGFQLDERACELLRSEGVMYYHRYLALFVLEDYPAVVRDTLRNMRLFDFCHEYAEEESDRFILEQYRPYVLMMCSRARAHLALADNRPKAALASVRNGIDKIRRFYEQFEADLTEHSTELAILQAMARDIESSLPVDPIKKLREDLAEAVENERYEEAATLRDRLDHLTRDDDSYNY
jgi:hypothetical protein